MNRARTRTLTALGLVVALAPSPAEAQISFGPAFAADDPVLEPGPGPEVRGIEPVGSDYLVWGGRQAISVRSDGTASSPYPFVVNRASDFGCSDTMCLMGRDMGVEAAVQRMRPDGTYLDATPIVLAIDAASTRVAWRGTGWLVAWSTSASIGWQHVRPDGTPVGSPESVALPSGDGLRLLDVDCTADHCLLALERIPAAGERDLHAFRIDAAGSLLDAVPFSVMDEPHRGATVRWQGSWYLVAATRISRTQEGVRVDADGRLLDARPRSLFSTAATCNPRRCLLTGTSGSQIQLGTLDPSGEVTAPNFLYRADPADAPEDGPVACNASGCLVAWTDGVTDQVRLLPTDLDGTLTATSPVTPVMRANEQRDAVVGTGDAGFLTVWRDERAGTEGQLRASRISGGASLDAADAILLPATFDSSPTDVAYGAGVYAILHQDDRNTWFRRVSAGGEVLDATPIQLSFFDTVSDPDLSFDGANFFVVGTTGSELVFRRLAASGATLEPSFTTLVAATRPRFPAVAFDGTNHLVVWEETRTRGTEIYGVRATTDGTPLETLTIPIGSAEGNQSTPRVAFGGGTHFVVWSDARSGTGDVYGTRVRPDGSVLDPLGIPIREGSASITAVSPQVVFDGTAFFVGWFEHERNEDPVSGVTTLANYIAAVRLASDGTPDSEVFRDGISATVSGGGYNVGRPQLAAGSPGVVSVSVEDDESLDNSRIRIREVVDGAPPGGPCTEASDCGSGFCVGSICCDRACDGGCEACRATDGASTDGYCETLPAGTECRASSGAACDLAELCDGTSPMCPPDVPMTGCAGDDAGTSRDGGASPFDGGASADAGSEMDGSDGGPGSGDGSGCSVRGLGDAPVGGFWLAGLAALALLRRRA